MLGQLSAVPLPAHFLNRLSSLTFDLLCHPPSYTHPDFNAKTCSILTSLDELPHDEDRFFEENKLSDAEIERIPIKNQATLFGFACDQTQALMPLPIWLAHKVARQLHAAQQQNILPYLTPDGKTQVGIEYRDRKPYRIHSITVIATQSEPGKPDFKTFQEDIRQAVIYPVFANEAIKPDDKTRIFVNPEGSMLVGGPSVHSGLTGRKNAIDTDLLVTERAGRIRLVRDGQLQPDPVATVPVSAGGEGGLLGMAAHPDFEQNRLFYLYYTAQTDAGSENRVERWRLAPDGRSASLDKMILDGIPVARFHNGGRLRFGPDGMLYIGTGDARDPQLSQNVDSLAGKILRLTPEGEVPADNPFPDNPTWIWGIRNTQGFDWVNESTMWVTDHGPSGDLGRTGHDEVNAAQAGDNLGWPAIYGCQSQPEMVRPSLSWRQAVPPGGATIYTGDAIPQWQGSLIVGVLGAKHLHRVTFAPDDPDQVQSHEVYFQGDPP